MSIAGVSIGVKKIICKPKIKFKFITANLLGSTDTNDIENDNEKDQAFIEQRFGTETKGRTLEHLENQR